MRFGKLREGPNESEGKEANILCTLVWKQEIELKGRNRLYGRYWKELAKSSDLAAFILVVLGGASLKANLEGAVENSSSMNYRRNPR